jgi:hypothetical protein
MPAPAAPPDPLAGLLDALVDRLAPRVAALVVEQMREAAKADAPPLPTGLVDRRDAARALGISIATLDRLARDGAPVRRVGARRRFDLDELRAWLEARGRRPAAATRPVHRRRDDDVDDDDVVAMAEAAGIRRR